MSGTRGGGKKHMSQGHKPQKQENIPQLCVCMCGYVHKCVCVATMDSEPGCKLQGERERKKRRLGRRKWSGAVTYVITIKEEGAEEGISPSEETGGWAWGSRRAPI